jgi:hypothetical protein
MGLSFVMCLGDMGDTMIINYKSVPLCRYSGTVFVSSFLRGIQLQGEDAPGLRPSGVGLPFAGSHSKKKKE